jgi:enoyl-[acyl-carrier protein] reductase II
MFEGDLSEGELEIGQVAGLFDEVLSAKEIIEQIVKAYNTALTKQQTL